MTVPLKDYEYTNYRWVDGFEFLITVEAADADSYALGNILIPKQEENPFVGYESNLLELIQVNPAYYQIHTVAVSYTHLVYDGCCWCRSKRICFHARIG